MYVDENIIENKKKECLNNQKILTLLHKQTIPLEEDVTSFIIQLMNTANRLLKQITHDRLQLILDNKLYLQEEDHLSLVEDSTMLGLCIIVLGYSLSSMISHQDILFIDHSLQEDYHETLINTLSISPYFSSLYITK